MLYLCQIFCIIAFFIPYYIYEEKKNSKKDNKENTLKGKVTDFLFMVNMAFSLSI